MIFILIILIILIILLLIFLAICFSSLSLEIISFNADNIDKTKIIKKYLIYIRLYLFGKIKWLGFKIDNNKVNKFKQGSILRWIDKKLNIEVGEEINKFKNSIIENRKKIFNKELLKYTRNIKIDVEKLNLKLDIGLENAILTSYSVAFIASIISILLAQSIDEYSNDKYYYSINPKYINQNIFKLELNCIIFVKMVHIMNIIYVLIRKRSDSKNGRTSNRRSNDYSYEQHTRYG